MGYVWCLHFARRFTKRVPLRGLIYVELLIRRYVRRCHSLHKILPPRYHKFHQRQRRVDIRQLELELELIALTGLPGSFPFWRMVRYAMLAMALASRIGIGIGMKLEVNWRRDGPALFQIE